MKIATQARNLAGPPVEAILLASFVNAYRQRKVATSAGVESIETSNRTNTPETKTLPLSTVNVRERVAMFSTPPTFQRQTNPVVSASSPSDSVVRADDVKRCPMSARDVPSKDTGVPPKKPARLVGSFAQRAADQPGKTATPPTLPNKPSQEQPGKGQTWRPSTTERGHSPCVNTKKPTHLVGSFAQRAADQPGKTATPPTLPNKPSQEQPGKGQTWRPSTTERGHSPCVNTKKPTHLVGSFAQRAADQPGKTATPPPPPKKPIRVVVSLAEEQRGKGQAWTPSTTERGHSPCVNPLLKPQTLIDGRPVPPPKPTNVPDPNEQSWITRNSHNHPILVVQPLPAEIPDATQHLNLPPVVKGQHPKTSRIHVYEEIANPVDGRFSVSDTTLQLSGEEDGASVGDDQDSSESGDGGFSVSNTTLQLSGEDDMASVGGIESASDDEGLSVDSASSDGSFSRLSGFMSSIPGNLNALKRAVSYRATTLFRKKRGPRRTSTHNIPNILPVPTLSEGNLDLCPTLSVETIQAKFNDAETNLDFNTRALRDVGPTQGDNGWLLMDVLLLDILHQLKADVLIDFKPRGRADTFVHSFSTTTTNTPLPLFRVNPLVFMTDDLSHCATLIHNPSLTQIKESMLNFLRILSNSVNQTADTFGFSKVTKPSNEDVDIYIRHNINPGCLQSDIMTLVYDWSLDPEKDVDFLTDELTKAARKYYDFERHPRYTQML